MVACMDGPDGIEGVTYNRTFSIPNNAESCAGESGLDYMAINDCANSEHGQQLLHDSHILTSDMFAEHGGYTPEGYGYYPPLIPNIWIYDADGAINEYNNPLVQDKNPYYDILGRVCRAFGDEAEQPDVCKTAAA